MTRKRIAPVLTLAALLIAAWSGLVLAQMQPMYGAMGQPMPMPVNVGPKKCAPPPTTCMPQGCAPMACAPQQCAPAPCPPQACAPAPCPPQPCAPNPCAQPPCNPPMWGPPMLGGRGYADCGQSWDARSCVGGILDILGAPFRWLENAFSGKKCGPPQYCPPPQCFPMAGPPAGPANPYKRAAGRPPVSNNPGFMMQ